MLFFDLDTFWLDVSLVVVIGGSTLVGIAAGRRLRGRPDSSSEPIGVVQGALLGLVGLLLAFGLTMAVGRYEARRTLVVHEANTISTTYLRAQLLPEPMRSTSLDLLKQYGDIADDLADQVPFTDQFDADVAEFNGLQRGLWSEAGRAVEVDATGTGPLTYIPMLNEMFEAHTERMSSLRNRVPTSVMLLQIGGSAIAIGVLAAYLALLGRSEITALLAAAFVVVILFVSFDLDRPQRGFITVPYTALVEARTEMDLPPAAGP
ncbi:hypothetical protein [Ilumatobacter sp.]|uniref:bestrophin-like domain n=1 Tax=Ilumatobacter sp. TaxID=1967498 RepID=UPI003C551BB2